MPIYRRDGSPYWWYTLPNPHGGRRIRRSTGATEKAKAQRIHDEKKAELWKVKVTGRQFYDALSAWLVVKDRSLNDFNAVALIKREYKNRPLSDVTGDGIEQVFGNRAPGTYNRLANIIRAALNIAHRNRWMDTVPKVRRRKEPKKRVSFLTKDQWEVFHAKLPPHQQALAKFSVATGLRWSNASYLEWSQVDMQRKIAWVHPEDAKAGKTIPIPLSDEAMEVLESKIGEHPVYVFTFNGAPIASPKTAFKRAREAAGLPDFRWHDLRHTWASWHVMSGTPLAVLKELGGWSSMEMVEKYAHLAPSHLASYADNAKPFDGGKVVKLKRKKA